jgi:hypothetical protein
LVRNQQLVNSNTAQAVINTYQGITAGIKLGYPAAIPAVAATTVAGFVQLKTLLIPNTNTC